MVSTDDKNSAEPNSFQFIDEEFFIESPCESNPENSLSSNFDEVILSTFDTKKTEWDKDEYINKSAEDINLQFSNQVIFVTYVSKFFLL